VKESEWKITFCWVKAHAGVMGKELADALVKRVATNINIPESYSKIPKKRNNERPRSRKREDMAEKIEANK